MSIVTTWKAASSSVRAASDWCRQQRAALAVDGVGVLQDEQRRVGLRRLVSGRAHISASALRNVGDFRPAGARADWSLLFSRKARPSFWPARSRAEGRRCRLPDARRGRRRRVGHVDRGLCRARHRRARQAPARLLLAGGDAESLLTAAGDCPSVWDSAASTAAAGSVSGRRAHRAARGGEPADRPGAALGDGLRVGSGDTADCLVKSNHCTASAWAWWSRC